MKNSWRIMMVLAALGAIFGIAQGVRAQGPQIAGGYGDTSISEPEVRSAARFAVTTQGRRQGTRITLLSIERAEVQVVAGLNYRLRLKVKRRGRAAEEVTVVVYKDLRQRYSLTEWTAGGGQTSVGSAPNVDTLEGLLKALEEAYAGKSLDSLDAVHPYAARVKIVIVHSLAGEDDKDGVQTRVFRSMAGAERWLRSLEVSENIPFRATKPPAKCSKGTCTYDFSNGILHNHLYLDSVSYGMRNGRPYIKTIYLVDGD